MYDTKINTEVSRTIIKKTSIIEHFNHSFNVIIADTPKLQEQAYRLRYQVYCIENCFENTLDHPLKQESDDFDIRSVHSVIIDRHSQTVTGTVRVILPDPDNIEKSFPIQNLSNHPLLHNRKLLHTARAAEISRFAVSKRFSRMAADLRSSQRHSDYRIEQRAAMSSITLGLMNGIVRMSAEHGITEWFAVMEPTLLRLLARFGIYFSPIGPMVDYHGMRQPCHANMQNLLARVRKERLQVWEIITDKGTLLDSEVRAAASHHLNN